MGERDANLSAGRAGGSGRLVFWGTEKRREAGAGDRTTERYRGSIAEREATARLCEHGGWGKYQT